MDAAIIRLKFQSFVGDEKYQKFIEKLNTTCCEKGELLYWQEKLWQDFLIANDLSLETSLAYIAKVFNVDVPEPPLSTEKNTDSQKTLDISEGEKEKWKSAHKVWVCKECNKVSMEKFEACPKCSSKNAPIVRYRRLFIERIIFIPILMIIVFCLSFLFSDPFAQLLPLIVPCFYVLANEFLGIKFFELFYSGIVPSYAYKSFSWRRFFKEWVVFAGVLVVFAIAFAFVELRSWSNAQ